MKPGALYQIFREEGGGLLYKDNKSEPTDFTKIIDNQEYFICLETGHSYADNYYEFYYNFVKILYQDRVVYIWAPHRFYREVS